MAEVDSLEVQITADAKKASAQLDVVIGKLSNMADALKSIDTSAISSQIKKISESFSKINTKGIEKAGKEIQEVAKTASKGIKAKISFEASDYQAKIKELSSKFADAKKDFKIEGNLSQLEKQADKLSSSLERLKEKQDEIIAIGKKSPESEMFQRLQYNIVATTNKLGILNDAMKNLKMPKTGDFDLDNPDFKIIRYNADFSQIEENAEKVKEKVTSTLEDISEKVGYLPEKAQQSLSEALQNAKADVQVGDGFRNFTKEVIDATAKLKELETAGYGMGSDKWDEAYIALQKVKEEAKEYKAHLDNPSYGLDEDIKKTDSLGNKVEELKARLKELKAQGLNFGDANFDKTYSDLQKADAELKEYKSNLSGAGKESKNFANISTPNFEKVTNAIQKMGSKISSAVKNIGSASNPLKMVASSSDGLAKKLGKLFIVFQSLRGLGNIFKSSIDLSSDLTEVQNVIDVSFGKYKKSIEDFSKISIPQFGMSELTAKQIAGRFQSMGVAVGYSQKRMSDMSVELTKLAADMASFYNVEQADVAKSLESVFTGTTMPMRRYGVDLTTNTLQEWAHKQGIDAKMKSMSQAEKVMLRYQYVMANTAAAQGDFARTADTWANQLRVLRQNFEILGSTVGGVLINALKPFVKGLNVIMEQINNFAKIISNALGKIFGWTYEEGGGVTNPADDLADSMGDVADATDKATKKQKEFNKQLGKIDELQNFTTSKNKDKDNDGGADLSGLGGAGYGGAWKQGESIIKSFESDIDTLYKLGQTIGDALSKAMESIDWDNVYKKAKNFGSGLAKFLNGLFTGSKGKRLFKNLGKTIANAINASMYALLEFAKTFDWKSFGENLGEGINSFFENWDAGLTAETFNKFVGGILDAMIKGVQTVKWEQVAQKIADLISGIDAKGIGWKLGKLANSLANAFYQLVSNKDTWVNLGQKIADGINGIFKGMNDVDKKTGLTGWQALGKDISETIKGIATTITTALETVDWDLVGKSIADFIGSIDFNGVVWNLAKMANAAFDAIVKAVKGFTKTEPLGAALVGLFAAAKLTGLTGKLSGSLTTALAGKKLTLGKVLIGIGLGAATLKLADKGTWKSSIGAGITAFLAGKTFGGSTKLSLQIAGATVTAAAGFSLGKKIGKWIQNEMSSEDMEQYRYEFSFTDLFKYDANEFWQGFSDMLVDYGWDEEIEKLLKGKFKFPIPFTGITLPSTKDTTDKIKEWAEKVISKSKSATIINLAIKIGSKVIDMKDKISEFIGKLPQKAYNFAIGIGSTVSDIKESIQKKVTSAIGKVKGTIKLGFEFAKSAANAVINFINNALIKNLNKINFKFPEFSVFGKKIGGWKFGFNIPEIKGFEEGGFPKRYSAFIAGENGVPEMLGTVGGKTAVVGGAEITGIRDAIFSTSSQEVMLLREQNALLRALLDKDMGITSSAAFNAVRQENNVFKKRTGQSAFV